MRQNPKTSKLTNCHRLFLFLPFIGLLSGCLMTRTQVQEVENKRQMQDQVVHLQKNTADQQVRFNDINADLRELSGRLDLAEQNLKNSATDRQKLQTYLEEQLAESNKRVVALQQEVTKLSSQLATLGQTVTTTTAASPSSVATDKRNPYEVAQDFFQKKDYKNAVLWYQKYRDRFPTGRRIPDAIFQMGVSFQELGMKEDARVFFNEVIERFPQSAQATAAKARLRKVR